MFYETPKTAPAAEKNNTDFAGRPASERVLFGEFGRYGVQAMHTRQADVMWFVFDAERKDKFTGGPLIIRQEPDFNKAVETWR